jgi:DNA-directed RNA polymerase subunit N (RpoN/RPB10)
MPVRCITCGKIVGDLEGKFLEMLSSGLSQADATKNLNLSRYCCNRMFLGYVNVLDKLLLFPDDIETGDKKNTAENS